MVTQFSREACSLRLVAEREAEGKAGPGETSVLWMMNTREFVDNWAPRDVRLSALGLCARCFLCAAKLLDVLWPGHVGGLGDLASRCAVA